MVRFWCNALDVTSFRGALFPSVDSVASGYRPGAPRWYRSDRSVPMSSRHGRTPGAAWGSMRRSGFQVVSSSSVEWCSHSQWMEISVSTSSPGVRSAGQCGQ